MKRKIVVLILAVLALPLLGAPQIVNHSPTTSPQQPPLICQWVPFLCVR